MESVLTQFTGRPTPFVGAATQREPSRGNAKTPRRQDAKNGTDIFRESRRESLVRLGWRWDRAVEVRLCAVKNRAVSNRNCVVATRGGEQRNENDQSVTQTVRVGSRRELDSVGVAGRVC